MDYPTSETDVNLYEGKFTEGDSELGIPCSRDPASWANAVTDEFRNFFLAMGITPSETDVTQLLQGAMTLVGYYVCTDGGSANDYELTPLVMSAPSAYYNGMTVVWKAANAPTGASVISVGTLDDVDLVDEDGGALDGDEFAGDDWVAAKYNLRDDQFELTELYRPKRTATFVNNPDGSPTISSTWLDVDNALTIATWESVGPTDSGADNIWTALDDVPSDADWIRLRVVLGATEFSGSSLEWLALYARRNGTTPTIIQIAMAEAYPDQTTNNAYAGSICEATIQVDSGVFDLQWDSTFSNTNSVDIYLIGWGYNS